MTLGLTFGIASSYSKFHCIHPNAYHNPWWSSQLSSQVFRTGFVFIGLGRGRAGPHCIAQTGLELVTIILPQDYKHEPPDLTLKLWLVGSMLRTWLFI